MFSSQEEGTQQNDLQKSINLEEFTLEHGFRKAFQTVQDEISIRKNPYVQKVKKCETDLSCARREFQNADSILQKTLNEGMNNLDMHYRKLLRKHLEPELISLNAILTKIHQKTQKFFDTQRELVSSPMCVPHLCDGCIVRLLITEDVFSLEGLDLLSLECCMCGNVKKGDFNSDQFIWKQIKHSNSSVETGEEMPEIVHHRRPSSSSTSRVCVCNRKFKI